MHIQQSKYSNYKIYKYNINIFFSYSYYFCYAVARRIRSARASQLSLELSPILYNKNAATQNSLHRLNCFLRTSDFNWNRTKTMSVMQSQIGSFVPHQSANALISHMKVQIHKGAIRLD